MKTPIRHRNRPITALVVLSFLFTLFVPASAYAGGWHHPRGGHGHGDDHPTRTTGCRLPTPITPGQSADQTVESAGMTRTYVLHVPATYNPRHRTPVIVAFHGRKGTGAELEEFSGLSTLNAIVAYPNGLSVDGKTAWEGAPYSPESDDVLFVTDLLDQLQSTLCVDANRIYATGKSNGAGFTALLACRLPHRIAAFAPVSGAFYPQTTVGCDQDRYPVPMMEFHGTADTIIEYAGGESHGAPFPAITDWLQRWVDRDHCRSFSTSTIGTDVTVEKWNRCARHTEVVHYKIEGAGHTWPGELSNSGPGSATQTISATQIMWDFFLDHPLHGHRH